MSVTITDIDELQAMGDDLDGDYVLGNNIDASATETWNINNGFIPIGFYGTPFSGTFDGQGYKIHDFWSRRSTANNIGLFGEVDGATIQDVTLENFTTWGDDKVGTLAGECDNSTISNVIVTGANVKAEDDYAGGLIGDATTCTISECSTAGAINMVGDTSNYGGGLIGACYTSTLNRCYSTASVDIDNDMGGGLIGLSYRNDIDNCYATGAITGDASSSDYLGGLIGYSYDSQETVDDCFSTGAVTGFANLGGLMGYSTSTVSNCFWDTETSGQASSAAGTGKTTANMLLFATFYDAGWNLGQASATRNNGYPYLGWETDDTDYTWYIYGEGIYPSAWSFPDLLDYKGRPVKNAVIDAIRTDAHRSPCIIETQRTDANGTCSFSLLPIGKDIVFHARYGGIATEKKEEWFFLRVNQIEDGGTGSGTAAGALDNLGVHGAAIIWELVLGD